MPNYKVEFEFSDTTEEKFIEKYSEALLRKVESAILNVNKMLAPDHLPVSVEFNDMVALGAKSDLVVIDPEFANDVPQSDLETLLFHEASHVLNHDLEIKGGLELLLASEFSDAMETLKNPVKAAKIITTKFGSVDNFLKQTGKIGAIMGQYASVLDSLGSLLQNNSQQLAERLIESPSIQKRLGLFNLNRVMPDFQKVTEFLDKIGAPEITEQAQSAIISGHISGAAPIAEKGKTSGAKPIDPAALRAAIATFNTTMQPIENTLRKFDNLVEKLEPALEYRADFLSIKASGAKKFSDALNFACDWTIKDMSEEDKKEWQNETSVDSDHPSTANRVAFAQTILKKMAEPEYGVNFRQNVTIPINPHSPGLFKPF